MISTFRYYMKKEILYFDLTVVLYCKRVCLYMDAKGSVIIRLTCTCIIIWFCFIVEIYPANLVQKFLVAIDSM